MRGRALGPGRIRSKKRPDGSLVYTLEYRDARGRRRRLHAGTSKAQAERVRTKLIYERDLELQGLATQTGSEVKLADLAREYMRDLEARCSTGHVVRVRFALDLMLEQIPARTVGELRPMDVVTWAQVRKAGGAANATVNRDVSALKTMLTWAAKHQMIAPHPVVVAVEKYPAGAGHQNRPSRALTVEEIGRLIEAARRVDAAKSDRARAVRSIRGGSRGPAYAAKPRVPQAPTWVLMIETGARFGALSQATWGDFDPERRTLQLRASTVKGKRRPRVIPLRTAVVAELAALRIAHHRVLGRLPSESDTILLSPTGKSWSGPAGARGALRQLQFALDAASIPKVDARGRHIHLHALRKTFATQLARGGAGLREAQELMGHTDPKLTAQIYQELETEDLRAAIEKMPSHSGVPPLPGTKLPPAEEHLDDAAS